MHHVLRALLFAAVVLGTGCTELMNGTGQISQRIGAVVSDPAAREVDLGPLTTFGWDRFYVFKPGTSREEICRFLGANRNVCGRIIRYTAVPADSMTLVFGLNGHLTHTELHALANGEFDLAPGDDGYPREACIFRIHRISTGTEHDKVRLEPR